jgi:hypothetical protein
MSTPPGWYPDPQQAGFVRWWDGSQWTPHANPAAAAQQAQTGWYGAQPTAWAGQPATYGAPGPGGAPAGPGWVNPSNPGQWGAAPAVYFAPGKRRGKRWWWVFGALASVVVLAIGGGLAWLIVAAVRQVQAPENAASAYLKDLTTGRYGAAYARLCSVDTAQVSLTRFAQSKAARHPVSYRIYGADVVTTDGIKTATVHFDETTSTGDGSTTSQLTLEHNSTGWYVCHRGIPASAWAGVPSAAQTGPTLPAALRTRNGATGLVLSD